MNDATLTAAQVLEYTNAGADSAEYAKEVAEEAMSLVNDLLSSPVRPVPDAIRHRCYLEAASELFHRRQAPNGIAQFGTPDMNPIRVARDPLVGVYPLVSRYLGGFA